MTIDGTLKKNLDGCHEVGFDRLIDRPVAKVWAALVDPAIAKNWLGDVTIEPRLGGRYEIHFRNVSVVMTGRITAFEPERLLEYTWLENYGMPASKVRWGLAQEGSGCRLILSHIFPPQCLPKDIVGFLGGWQAFLEIVASASDGTFVPYLSESEFDAAYRARYLADQPLA